MPGQWQCKWLWRRTALDRAEQHPSKAPGPQARPGHAGAVRPLERPAARDARSRPNSHAATALWPGVPLLAPPAAGALGAPTRRVARMPLRVRHSARRTRRVCLTARQAICRGLKPVLNDIFKNDSTRVPLWKWVCNPKSCCCAGHTCFYNHHQSLQSLLLACAAAHAREGFSAAMMLRRAAAAAVASSASALASRASSLRAPAAAPLLARRLHDDITSMVGNTPVVRLNRVAPPHVTMYAKCEFMNPVRGSSYGARRKACKLCCLPSPLCTRARACASPRCRLEGPHVGSEAKCQLRRQGG